MCLDNSADKIGVAASRAKSWKVVQGGKKMRKLLAKMNFLITYNIFNFVRIYNLQMETKLTLKLNGDIIEQAKNYAKKKNTSLSKLIESYLGLLVNPNEKQEVTPLVKSLSGVIDLPEDFDNKTMYRKHILNKYSK
jgi:hypothetical protein